MSYMYVPPIPDPAAHRPKLTDGTVVTVLTRMCDVSKNKSRKNYEAHKTRRVSNNHGVKKTRSQENVARKV